MDKTIKSIQYIYSLNYPIYIEIGSTRILLHAVTEVLAFFIGFRYFLWLHKKKGDTISSPNRIWIVIGAIFGSLIGSRLIGGLEDPPQVSIANNVLVYFYMNKTVLGGFVGGLFGVELTKKIIGEKQASGDLFVYPILLALIIGRIGCFSMGVHEETYGNITSFPTGMNLGDGYMRHPVCLYEIGFLVLLWIGLVWADKNIQLQQGARFKLFMISYLVFRLLLDFIKPHFTFSIGLSTIQLTCIAGLLWYAPFILRPKKMLTISHA